MTLSRIVLALDAGPPIEILAVGLIVLVVVFVLIVGAIALTTYLIKRKFGWKIALISLGIIFAILMVLAGIGYTNL